MSNEIARLLPWDTDFFGHVVARVEGDRLGPDDTTRLDAFSREHGVEWVYLLCDAHDMDTVRVASAAGFELMDVRIQLEARLSDPRPEALDLPDGLTIRDARAEDRTSLEAIAADVHTDSRFFADQRVPRERARALFETWMARSLDHALADLVLTVDLDGKAYGYCTARKEGESCASIGLLGVGPEVRGRGVAGALVGATLDRLKEEDISVVSVVTQGKNASAQRVYQRCGFLTRAVKFWFHKWIR